MGGTFRDGNPSSLAFSDDKDIPISEDPENLAAMCHKIH